MSKPVSTYSDYSALAHAVVRVSDGKLGIGGSGLLSLFAKARGFDSSQAFKASFPVSPEAPQGVSSPAPDIGSAREKISAQLRSSVSEFFFSGFDVSKMVREAVTEAIFQKESARAMDIRSALYGRELHTQFIEDIFTYPQTSKDFDLDYLVKIHGNDAYRNVCNSRNVAHMSFVDGLLFRVQRESAEIAFREMLDEMLTLLQLSVLNNYTVRQLISGQYVEPRNPEMLLNNEVFRQNFLIILNQLLVSEYMD